MMPLGMGSLTRRSGFSLQSRGLLLLCVLLALGVHSFYDYVFIAAEKIEDKLKNRPSGNSSDLYPAWLGTRELLVNQRDPYSPEVTADIQKGVWGRTVDGRNPGDPKDESRFAYPLYVVFTLGPTILLPFSAAKVLFIGFAITTSGLSVWVWLRLFGHRSTSAQITMGIVLFLGSWPFVLALRVHQPAVIVLASITGAMTAVAAGLPWAGGVMLAFATIKPQSAVGIVAWLLLWSVSNWKERKGLFLSFALTFSAMFVAAELLLPGWFWEWREALSAYMRYAPLTGAYVELMFGKWLGKIVGALVTLGLLLFCWKARRDAPNTDRFRLASTLILAANLFITPVWHAYDHIFLLPPFLLLWEWRQQLYCLKPVQRAIVRFSALALVWQWFAATVALAVVAVVPGLALNLRILPYFSILLLPPATLMSLVLIGRARLYGTVPDPDRHAAILQPS
jgi:hypothetical protein